MSKRDFLLEIGLQEVPARFVDEAIKQLTEKVTKWLDGNHITYSNVTPYATPRRLAVLIEEVSEKQQDVEEEAKGPAKKIAIDEKGEWTKAAQGFAKSQGVSPEALFFREIKGIEYVYLKKEIKGQKTIELLPQVKEIITGMTFPKNMRWGSHDLKYVRPIRWMVALFGEEIIPFEITGIETNRESFGHRFLGGKFSISEPKEYKSRLLDQYVIASITERREKILGQIQALEKENNWNIPTDQELLDEVVHLVEYPTAIYGSFDPDFLSIPEEVLITSMKEHQRYFPVQDVSGKLLPHFVTFRNGLEDPNGLVSRGNEKVLRARLSDARFFYEEDKKLKIDTALAKLENVVFHEELGTIGDKIRRIREISKKLATWLGCNKETLQKLDRAAEICKFDLVSQMVYEFPELQGRMGSEYALLAGEDKVVSKAIFEHYLPRYAGDDLPETEVGAIVSIADKLDSIIGCFGIGIVPTGSQDPYALRRQASGIVQMIAQGKWSITLDEMFTKVIDTFEKRTLLKRNREDVLSDLKTFFVLRLKNKMQENQIRYDVIDAVLENEGLDLNDYFAKADVLQRRVEEDSFKSLIETFTRVNNLAQKCEKEHLHVDPTLFDTEAESALHQQYLDIEEKIEVLREARDWNAVIELLSELKDPIDNYFEHVMVMVDDEKVRQNRLTLLKKVSGLINGFANFSKIVFS
jgi:glycyl-tRNA synthetase beta chain